MIAFGCAIADTEAYGHFAQPGIERASETDSKVLAFAAVNTVPRSLNILLDEAAEFEDLEGLVIVHAHTEILDPQLCTKARQALSDPEVAVVGVAGGAGIHSIAWWEGSVSCSNSFAYDYHGHGGGSFQGIPWAPTVTGAPAEVDALDGHLLILSPWAVRNLRFEEMLRHGYGCDVDLCFQARAAGRRVMTADLAVREWRDLDVVGSADLWMQAHVDFAAKWSEWQRARGESDDPRLRARRMEAERDAARSMMYFKRLTYEARIEALESKLSQYEESTSWRLTQPLRRINSWRGLRSGRRNGRAPVESA